MLTKNVQEAIVEARKFIEAAEELLRTNLPDELRADLSYGCPRESGIVKARSLILWRLLSKMRNETHYTQERRRG
ncbi:MAG: hypothetical protein PHT95_03225 [Candidatus Omnitrophica bacterium]|nr:hypothetical protein [Candidatus Omnitrophota bacterium]